MLRTVNQAILYDKQQQIIQDSLPDRSKIIWDVNESQVALLKATPEVGNDREITNESLENSIKGGQYKLTFVQDEVGGRNLSFGDKFDVEGAIKTAPNSVTVLNIYIEEGRGKVFVVGASESPLQRLNSITLVPENWVAGENHFYYDILNSEITPSSWVDISPHIESYDAVSSASVQPYTDSLEGKVRCYADSAPLESIVVDILIAKT
jgi:hypothetical protein